MEDIKSTKPNKALAKGLLQSSREKRALIQKIPEEIKYNTTIYCLVYDCIRELIDAILASDGLKSYSHKLSIEHLKKYDLITPGERNRIDIARQKRNNAQYYARTVNEEEIREFFAFSEEVIKKLETIVRADKV